jgi:hypothetical protein
MFTMTAVADAPMPHVVDEPPWLEKFALLRRKSFLTPG